MGWSQNPESVKPNSKCDGLHCATSSNRALLLHSGYLSPYSSFLILSQVPGYGCSVWKSKTHCSYVHFVGAVSSAGQLEMLLCSLLNSAVIKILHLPLKRQFCSKMQGEKNQSTTQLYLLELLALQYQQKNNHLPKIHPHHLCPSQQIRLWEHEDCCRTQIFVTSLLW